MSEQELSYHFTMLYITLVIPIIVSAIVVCVCVHLAKLEILEAIKKDKDL